MDRAKPQYYAISSHGVKTIYKYGQSQIVTDWEIMSGPHKSREEAQQKGEEAIGPIYREERSKEEIYRSTLHKNMVVTTKSQLQKYRITLEQ